MSAFNEYFADNRDVGRLPDNRCGGACSATLDPGTVVLVLAKDDRSRPTRTGNRNGVAMSGFSDYLSDKRTVVRAARKRAEAAPPPPKQVSATVVANDRAGVRKVRVRDHRWVLDSGPETGGFDLGPSPVEALLGSLGGCLAHTIMVQAALREIPLDGVEVEVAATVDPRAGHPAHPDVPFHPTDLSYIATITSPADETQVARLLEASERVCPVTALLVQPQPVSGRLVHIAPVEAG